jgi:AhpD family alkylhydroperoxidase
MCEVNGCNYCLTVHSFTAEHMAKLPADEIILARKGHASDLKRDAALQFARAKSSRPAARSVTPI